MKEFGAWFNDNIERLRGVIEIGEIGEIGEFGSSVLFAELSNASNPYDLKINNEQKINYISYNSVNYVRALEEIFTEDGEGFIRLGSDFK